MSIRLNQKVIAGNYERRPVSYRYVGEIFQSAIPITDKKVACLDGKKIYSGEGYDSFIQYLTSQSLLYPQLVCTEEIWQEKVEQYGSWGQFVINTQENSVRLPKIAGFVQGLNTLEDLAGLLEAGLPNIEGNFGDGLLAKKANDTNNTSSNINANGAFTGSSVSSGTVGANSTTSATWFVNGHIILDASLSNPIYGKSTTVQPQAIQYPYYIVLATGVVQEINVKNEVELNNPFFLGMSEYFETEPNNLSWLKSDNQWNNGSVYESFYEWLINSYNEGNENVKLVTEEYDDYNFVINKEEGTFRLPLLDGSESIFSDKYIDLTYAGHGVSYTAPANGWYNILGYGSENAIWLKNNSTGTYNSAPGFIESVSNTGVFIPCKKGDEVSAGYYNGTVSQFRFVYAKGNGSLYYYVGETVQNVNIINTSKLIEKVEGVNNKYKSQITNCITEIPQRIKLELNNGTLTLKAGSVVVVPYGTEDLTAQYPVGSTFLNNNFKVYHTQFETSQFFVWAEVVTDILDHISYGGTNPKRYLSIDIVSNMTSAYIQTKSGNATTTSLYSLYYNTDTNVLGQTYNTDNVDYTTTFCLPFAITTVVADNTNKTNSIDQVFNGMGYIGSTIWLDKGVKGLIPNGRNEDGSYNNELGETTRIHMQTNPFGAVDGGLSTMFLFSKDELVGVDEGLGIGYKYVVSTVEPSDAYVTWYNPQTNLIFYRALTSDAWQRRHMTPCMSVKYDFESNTKKNTFTGLIPKQPFRAIDYSDKPQISGWGMPSNKYIDLTLGASGSKYTAPANGWFSIYAQLSKETTTVGGYVGLYNETKHPIGGIVEGCFAGNSYKRTAIPCMKGDIIAVTYANLTTYTPIFRFYYAEGEV